MGLGSILIAVVKFLLKSVLFVLKAVLCGTKLFLLLFVLVARLAVEKCKAAGMITLPENLDRLLAEGKITQEEYEEYYPYDGCGYYSVFVETNLNLASTISGERLCSEEEIADYIAGMMVLEIEPYFYIECAGVYQGNSVEFYEFRCYR